MPKTPTANTLFYGDNLRILRRNFGDARLDVAVSKHTSPALYAPLVLSS